MTTSTDVKHSIAGYYYQLLLACKELVNLLQNESEECFVAIEKGSDVRVYNGNDLSIEAKFYKTKNFTRNSNTIRHTLYNFSYLFKEYLNNTNAAAPAFLFKTNIKISTNDKSFFEDWNDNNFSDISIYSSYIKDCLVIESIKRSPIKEVYLDYKINHHNTYKEDSDYYSDLLEELHLKPEQYPKFINPDRFLLDDDLESFIKSMKFSFEQKCLKKAYVIDEIKNSIYQDLKNFDKNLNDEDCIHISNIVLERFFESTYDDAFIEVNKNDLIKIIENKHQYKIKHIEQFYIRKSLDVINSNLKLYSSRLKREDVSDEIKEKIMGVYLEAKEKLFEEIEKNGYELVLQRYIMGIETNTNLLMKMLKPFFEVYSTSKIDLGSITFSDLGGINNLMFDNHKQFALKGTSSDEERANEFTLLGTFFNDIDQKNYFSKLDNTEVIIFDCDSQSKPCKYDKSNLSDTVFDIADTSNTIQIQEYYKKLDFRCSHCLSLNSTEKCNFSKELRG